MASGVSAYGGLGQCFRFSHALVLCRMQTSDPRVCSLEFQDYQECIDKEKYKRRIADKYTKLRDIEKEHKGSGDGHKGH
jgi:NADH:ubiquinone oxidoreductase, NDUFS5-15kDa